MVRDNSVHIKLSDSEFKELKEKAEKAHLPVASYCRHIIFEEKQTVGVAYQQLAPQIAIERLNKPKPPPDPYIIEKQKTHSVFKEDVQKDLFEALAEPLYLKPLSDDIKNEIKEYHDSRKVIINKESKAIAIKNKAMGL